MLKRRCVIPILALVLAACAAQAPTPAGNVEIDFDFSRHRERTQFVTYVSRWRLDKRDPAAPASAPIRPIVFHIDHTIPHEYRRWVREGVEAWNRAFEAAGFTDAIVARDAPDDDSAWSPEDPRYSTIRWMASPGWTGAYAAARTDPRTGEILSAHVILHDGIAGREVDALEELAVGSPVASSPSPLCHAQAAFSTDLPLHRAILAGRDGADVVGGEVDDFFGAGLRLLIMHEVGHALGLTHNFKGAAGTPYTLLHDTAYTRAHGVMASVMDYVATSATVRARTDAITIDRDAMYHRYLEFPSLVDGGSIEPHWFEDGNSFWYAEAAEDDTIIYKVEPAVEKKVPLIELARLRDALQAIEPERVWPPYLVIEQLDLLNGDTVARLTVDGSEYTVQLDTYTVSTAPLLRQDPHAAARVFWSQPGWGALREERSPDGRWLAGIHEHDLYLRSTAGGGILRLTSDGEPWFEWNLTGAAAGSLWSPDGSRLAVKKVDHGSVPGQRRIDLAPWHVEYETRTELFIIDIPSRRRLRLESGGEPGERVHILGWRRDGSELLYLAMDRSFKQLDLRAADAVTGASRVIVRERQKTFVLGPDWVSRQVFVALDEEEVFIWSSERDGWNHLYLYAMDGTPVRRLTEGDYPVLHVDAVDEEEGWVYFTASGDPERPYDLHLYRMTLAGRDPVRLTEEPGQHAAMFSPSNEYYLDTHSAPDRPPVVELRRADGRLIKILSRANVDLLPELRWQPPEQFVVKAADGRTDLFGLLYKPYDFDPGKSYPVIEYIYGGPHLSLMGSWGRLGSFLGRAGTEARSGQVFGQALAQLGFIVFLVDGRGTPDRGKAFQDFGHGKMGLHEIPERVAVLEGLARARPYMDLGRVGIVGRSFGGYMVLRAMLTAPDVYHAGAANDAFVELIHRAEIRGYIPYLGWLEENRDAYARVSVLPLAGNLEGRLLLSHGEGHYAGQADKLVSAVAAAGRTVDVLPPLPGQGHFLGGIYTDYWQEAVRRHVQEHLSARPCCAMIQSAAALR